MEHPARKRLASLKLAFIGDANWDIYSDENGSLWAIAKSECPGAADAYFGDKDHIKRLINEGSFSYKEVTDAGLELLSGLGHRFITPEHGAPWPLLTFHV